jgi:hypothetical protein
MQIYPKLTKPPKDNSKRFCNCCGKFVETLYHEEVGERVCAICRSYDVSKSRDTIERQ